MPLQLVCIAYPRQGSVGGFPGRDNASCMEGGKEGLAGFLNSACSSSLLSLVEGCVKDITAIYI